MYLNYNPLKSVDSDVYPSSLVELFMEYMPELTDVKDGSLASLINLHRIYIQVLKELPHPTNLQSQKAVTAYL